MEFNQLSEKGMERVVSHLVEEPVVFQMEDSHAFYFDGANGAKEYKVVIDQEELSLNEREQGKEDWYDCFGVELTEEVIASII
jgi:hypothetical protein